MKINATFRLFIFAALLTLGIFGASSWGVLAAEISQAPLAPGNPIIDPAANDHTVPVTSTVSITYDEDIDPSTVNAQTFAVQAMQTGLLTETFTISGGEIMLTPNEAFKPGELVQVSATRDTLGLPGGEGPAEPTVWQFRTAVGGGTATMIPHPTTPQFGAGGSRGVALGDIDQDGDLDAVVANYNNDPETVWLNDGTGNFSPHPVVPSFGSGYSSDVALGDLDSDGDLDAVISNVSLQNNTVWLNDGTGSFSPHPATPAFGGSRISSTVQLGDLDGDGDLDAVIAEGDLSNNAETVWLNDGNGNFSPHPTTPTFGGSRSRDLALGDLDNDGDLDAVVANDPDPNTVWLNDGTGNFSAHPSVPNFGGTGVSFGAALGDLDGDADLDAIITAYGELETIWVNDGTGGLTPHPTPSFDGGLNSYEGKFGDFDADGDLDTLIVNSGPDSIWLNDGMGSFTLIPGGSFGSGWSHQAATGDLDADGDLDIIFANFSGQPETVWLNEPLSLTVTSVTPPGNGTEIDLNGVISATFSRAISTTTVTIDTFTTRGMQTGVYTGTYAFPTGDQAQFDATEDFKPGEIIVTTLSQGAEAPDGTALVPFTWQFRAAVGGGTATMIPHPTTPEFGGGSNNDSALGDLDGDGDLDVVIANAGTYLINELWVNDGLGNFIPHPTTPSFGSNISTDVALGDIDNDGDLDAIISNYNNHPETVWLNDGAGNLTPHPTTPEFGAGDSWNTALGDIDGDGDLDALVSNGNLERQTVWLNDGVGNFSPHPTTPIFDSIGHAREVVLGDLDMDGDLDAVVAKRFAPETVWVNDGAGNFSAHPSTPNFGGGDSVAIILGDIDQDFDLDAIVGNRNNEPETVWLNDGTGNFSAHPTTPSFGADFTLSLDLGDLDADGDLDLAVGNGGDIPGEPETIWVNDGNGNFTPNPLTPSLGTGRASTAQLGDLDADGDIDLLVSNTGPQTVWLNEPIADLAIAKSVAPENLIGPGESISYTLAFTNSGPLTATDIIITDVVPTEVTTVDFTSSLPITPTGMISYTWLVPNLAPGENGTITITGITAPNLTPGLIFTNTVSISGSTYDIELGNNTSAVTNVITASLQISNLEITPFIDENDSVTLNGMISSYDPLSTLELVVDWGDTFTETYLYPPGTTIFTETHQYLDDDPSGTPFDPYTVTLVLTDESGRGDTTSVGTTVYNLPPEVAAGGNTMAEKETPVNFVGSFGDVGTLDTHTILWDFGDGNTTTGNLTPTHTYDEGGIYTVTLTIMDDDTGVGTNTLIAYINPIYENDFEDTIVGDEWCDDPTQSTTPSGRGFLGEFSNQTVCLTLDNLPENITVTVSFDLYIIRSWDGNQLLFPGTEIEVGPDEWTFHADAETLLHTSFSNWHELGFLQSYPDNFPNGDYPARSGAVENNTLGYISGTGDPMDAVYHLTFEFNHTSGPLVLDFTAMGLQMPLEDESWGLDNVFVYLGNRTKQTRYIYLPIVIR